MNKDVYEGIKQRGNKFLKLPSQHVTLVSAFNDNSQKVKKADICAFEIRKSIY